MGTLEPLDIIAAAILAIALSRGLVLGLVREAFSLGAIAGACIAVRLFATPLGGWLGAASGGAVGERSAPWLAGAGLVVATLVVAALVGRGVRRGVRAVGLGWADRAGGALLGAAEGALVVVVLLSLAIFALGRSHPVLADTRSLAALEHLERLAPAGSAGGLDVAAPPRR